VGKWADVGRNLRNLRGAQRDAFEVPLACATQEPFFPLPAWSGAAGASTGHSRAGSEPVQPGVLDRESSLVVVVASRQKR
jgi:hypothetical protein